MKIKLKPTPNLGDKRKVKKFAWIPFVLEYQNTKEKTFIWLSFYYEEQEYNNYKHFDFYSGTEQRTGWITINTYYEN
jgi:hypothetical protein